MAEDVYPASRVNDCPYSPRMLRLIADAQRTGRDLIHLRLSGWWLIDPANPSTKGTRFAVEGNRLRLLRGPGASKGRTDV